MEMRNHRPQSGTHASRTRRLRMLARVCGAPGLCKRRTGSLADRSARSAKSRLTRASLVPGYRCVMSRCTASTGGGPMHARVLLLALSCLLVASGRPGARQAPTPKAPPPEASQFDFLLGEWTVDVSSKAPGTPPRYGERGQSADGRTTILKIRCYNIQPSHFSWASDHSSDGGATWVTEYLRIEATRRVKGPAAR